MQLDSDFSEFVASFAAHDVRFMIVGGTVPFIGRADLIVNKRAVGRPQDIADVLRLTRPQPPDTP